MTPVGAAQARNTRSVTGLSGGASRFLFLSLLAIGLIAPSASGASGKPDLKVTSLSSPPAALTPGATFTASSTLRNGGRARARASAAGFYLSLDGTRSDDDSLLGRVKVAKLRPRRTRSRSATLAIPEGTATGSYLVLACADIASKVRERREGNNCRAAAARVQVAPAAPPCVDDASEDDDDIAHAEAFGGASYSLNRTRCPADSDFFTVNLNAEALTATVTPAGMFDPEVKLYSSGGGLLTSVDGATAGNAETLMYTAPVAETDYIEVTSAVPASSGDYTIQIQITS